MFNPKMYWNNRLTQNYSLNGVGDITLGNFNKYLYFIRKIAFQNIIRKLNISRSSTVADIGSGTGFYIKQWSKTKAKKIYGIDISKHAVEALSQEFKDDKYRFYEADISSGDLPVTKVDFVSAFDMLYHIVDDSKYRKAFKNINKMLSSKGVFIFSDNLLKESKEIRKEHQVCRSKTFIMQSLEEAGFEIMNIKPMFVLMTQVSHLAFP